LIISLVLGAALAALPIVQQAPIAITGVTIVDPRTGSMRPRSLVVVDKQRITYAGAVSTGKIPRRARVVNGRGKFLIPGLWDMHVHMTPGRNARPEEVREYYFAMLLANGVTGVRDMAGNLALLGGWRARVVREELLGPRLVLGGNKIGSIPVVPGAPDRVRSAADLRAIARLLKQGGADHVKMGDMPPGLMAEAGAAARAVGLPLVGHLPLGESASAAIEAGYRSIEHMHNILAAASTDEAGLLQRQVSFVHSSQLGVSYAEEDRPTVGGFPAPDPATIEDRRVLSLAAHARAWGTWFTPTLRATGRNTRQLGPLFGPGPAPYRRPPKTSAGHDDGPRAVRPPTPAQQAFWELSLRSVGQLHRGGAHLLAGTDSPNAAAGFSLADELELLVRAGLPPVAALRAATSEPADYLAAADSMGMIRPGFVADLVLLNGNPLEDIANVRRIRAVVVGGRLLERPALDSLLARAAVLALVAWSRTGEP
jgi:imidazolonepropionase-like amidohydrolase